jgi:hypothetical protein
MEMEPQEITLLSPLMDLLVLLRLVEVKEEVCDLELLLP